MFSWGLVEKPQFDAVPPPRYPPVFPGQVEKPFFDVVPPPGTHLFSWYRLRIPSLVFSSFLTLSLTFIVQDKDLVRLLPQTDRSVLSGRCNPFPVWTDSKGPNFSNMSWVFKFKSKTRESLRWHHPPPPKK